ncbi:ABC transporter permease [Natronorubrum sp. FCH18a]|uniref:ABC transporter permease n=1 Tax=Natronorubrum sp. FCH18a TaxID=3447018 RepID=UPI003F515908
MSEATEKRVGLRRYGHQVLEEKLFYQLLSVGVVLTAWEIASIFFIGHFLPRVTEVAVFTATIVSTGEFFVHAIDTTQRVAVGFGAAYTVSILLGIVMGLYKRAEYFFEILVLIGITIPGLGIVVLSIIWFGVAEMTAYVSLFILATPMIVFNFWKGMQSLDGDLVSMAHAFEVSRWDIFRDVLIPTLMPYMLAAARFGLALCWKIVVLVELLALTSGVGYMINQQFQVYSIVGVLGWTLSFTLIMMFVEFGILKPLERRATAWQDGTDEQRVTI